jgi:magnesium-transporting ATPase (P-type)
MGDLRSVPTVPPPPVPAASAPTLARAAAAAPEDVLKALGTSGAGLSASEAAARLSEFGPNRLPEAHGPGLPRQLAAQLLHFFALILWAAAGLALVGGLPELAVAIVVVVVLNGLFSFVQEYRAERATRALRALLPDQVTILREGARTTTASSELVPGDVFLIREGDRISADARLIRSEELQVDNSSLTGESEPVPRTVALAGREPSDALLAANVVFAGTHASSGWGTAVVVTTGERTRLGGIARLTGHVATRATPLHLEMNRAVRLIAALAVAAGIGFFAISVALGTPADDGFLFGVGVVVALVPEALLPTLTLSLAMSAARMADRGALVRHLEAVETLGSTTVVCSDKTGTLTANQMTARAISIGGQRARATGVGYDPAGVILVGDRPPQPGERATIEPLLLACALCANARLSERDGRWSVSGDPTEGALIVLAAKGGIERHAAERARPRVREYPFDSRRRRMSTLHALESGEQELFVKGSPEAVLEACAGLSAADRGDVDLAIHELASDGLRVLAFARRRLEGGTPPDAATAESDLELIGLVGLDDPVRPEAPKAIVDCRRAGIRVIMVTGDHPATASAVARKARLRHDTVLLGSDLPDDDRELATALASATVIARVAPEQKLRIAQALQATGEVVAMTGDGVNDAPALRQADIGIAMGKVGTDVAREAADVVLLDDNFAHIVEAVREGRGAYANIRRFLTYHLTDNVAELAPFVLWAMSGGAIPLMLSVLQILALDIGTDLMNAVALGAEPAGERVMHAPPRSRTERLLDRFTMLRAFAFLGAIEATLSMAMLPLGAAVLLGWSPGDALPTEGPDHAVLSTMVFAAIVVCQTVNAYECRSTSASLFSIGPLRNRLLVLATVVELLISLSFIYVAPIADVLGQTALSPREWALVALTPGVFLAAEELRKAVARRLARGPATGRSIRAAHP